jgi:alkanesulfonate monooxygenase SsuD/methylene tetrahydromethanopterin reductase-like flavin-dependent oxidoreductase (luciferase family)
MHAGIFLVFQNFEKRQPDYEIYGNNIAFGELAESLGYNSVWAVEHHFDADYAMCPDNFQVLSYLAARTTDIKLGTAAAILPWNDPLRVAEKAAMLDVMSNGRLILGLGRGLARLEFEGMRQDMGESRGRFDESADLIMKALETGYAEYSGTYYQQPRVEIHPLPLSTFYGRTYAVAVSPESAETAARLKLGMMAFVQGDVATVHLPGITAYRELYRKLHNEEPPPPIFSDFSFCHSSAERAAELANQYTRQYFRSIVTHYEMAGEHFGNTKGYEIYGQNAEFLREAGLEAAGEGFVGAQLAGSPDELIEKIQARREVIGDFGVLFAPYHGGVPYEIAVESAKLISKEVLPVIQKL